ncbi:MAG TPA: hypothetical protein VF094_10245 [Gaiellaceae bacterium]
MIARLPVLALVAVLLVGCGGTKARLEVGVVEDAAKGAHPAAELQRTADSGFHAVALSSLWSRGERAPAPAEREALLAATAAAKHAGVDPIPAVYQLSSQTPLSPADRADFAAYTAALVRELPDADRVIVGNEPNLNLFWMPQYDAAGGDAAAAAFEQLLAATYDAVKAARPKVEVIAGGLAPHGSDDPSSPRPTHSPTRFILDLGAAYRASGRDRPIMDALSIHPYGESARVPPTLAHPRTTSIGIADYGKLVDLLGRAFDGTAQRGDDLPVVYGEYGVETTIPAAKAHLYTGREVVPTVGERTQAHDYVTAIDLAACQRTVELLLLFHLEDESRLEGLQSGVRYADGSPKSGEPAVAAAADHPRCAR